MGREDQDNAVFMAVGRQGNRWWTASAADLDGNGTAGRFVVHYALDAGSLGSGLTSQADLNSFQTFTEPGTAGRDNVGIAVGDEVTVVLGHQAHNQNQQLAGPDVAGGGRVNTATFDNFTFQNSFDASAFNAAASNSTWNTDGTLNVDPGTGAVTGSAFVRDFVNNGGNATGEDTKWVVTANNLASFVPSFGTAGQHKDPTPMNTNDLVPNANFRLNSGAAAGSGLTAELYPGIGNGGTSTTALNAIASSLPAGTLTVSDINFTSDMTTGYYRNDPLSGGGFPAATGNTNFTLNENNYGVDFTGQIFIPANGGKIDAIEAASGLEYIVFEEGADDFAYLEIDGQVITDNNDWSSNDASANGGGHIALMDVSDPKYDDGEWVDFRFVMWEGNGDDLASLYWDAFDTDDSFDIFQTPGAFADPAQMVMGIDQVGDESTEDAFGLTLPEGEWLVTLDVSNTDVNNRALGVFTVVPEPGTAALSLLGVALAARRRRR